MEGKTPLLHFIRHGLMEDYCDELIFGKSYGRQMYFLFRGAEKVYSKEIFKSLLKTKSLLQKENDVCINRIHDF